MKAIGSILLGLAVGLVANGFMSTKRDSKAAAVTAVTPSANGSLAPAFEHVTTVQAQVDPEIAKRLEALEARERGRSNAEAASAAAPPEWTPEHVRENNAQHRDAHTKSLTDLRSRPADITWARDARANLESDFQHMTNDAHARSIECGNHYCRVEIEWSDVAKARAQATSMTRYSYSVNCVRDLYAPVPEGDDGPFVADLILDCTDHPHS